MDAVWCVFVEMPPLGLLYGCLDGRIAFLRAKFEMLQLTELSTSLTQTLTH